MYIPDHVAKVFNENAPGGWKARASCRIRSNTTMHNAVSFTYRGGAVQFLMDCDLPLGEGFQIKFTGATASFGDFMAAIQRGIGYILVALRGKVEPFPDLPDTVNPRDLELGIRKDGKVMYVRFAGVYEPSEQEKYLSTISADDLC